MILPWLIRRIGEPFINRCLTALPKANLSLRRFYVDRIVESGQSAVSHVGARLMDPRWFYVRNLVVILRSIGNAAAVPFLKALQAHPHAKCGRGAEGVVSVPMITADMQ